MENADKQDRHNELTGDTDCDLSDCIECHRFPPLVC